MLEQFGRIQFIFSKPQGCYHSSLPKSPEPASVVTFFFFSVLNTSSWRFRRTSLSSLDAAWIPSCRAKPCWLVWYLFSVFPRIAYSRWVCRPFLHSPSRCALWRWVAQRSRMSWGRGAPLAFCIWTLDCRWEVPAWFWQAFLGKPSLERWIAKIALSSRSATTQSLAVPSLLQHA